MRDLTGDDGKFKFDTYEDNLLEPPIEYGINPDHRRLNQKVCYSVYAPSYEPPSQNNLFIVNQEKQYSATSFFDIENDGFTIYVDAALNMPDNVSLVYIKAEVIDDNYEP